jgi:hypothetical protein
LAHPVHHIGTDLASKGVLDPAILPLLHKLTRRTLITGDRQFYNRNLRHRSYCLVFLDLRQTEHARFTRRFLRHPAFRTFAQRQGSVVRVGYEAVHVWRLGGQNEEELPWPKTRSAAPR